MKLIEKDGRTFVQAKNMLVRATGRHRMHDDTLVYHLGHDSNDGMREVLSKAGLNLRKTYDCMRWMAAAKTGDVRRWDDGRTAVYVKCLDDAVVLYMTDAETAVYREEDVYAE